MNNSYNEFLKFLLKGIKINLYIVPSMVKKGKSVFLPKELYHVMNIKDDDIYIICHDEEDKKLIIESLEKLNE